MSQAITRAQFLRGDFHGRRVPIRPPWARQGNAFLDRCTRCDDCLRACPEAILVRGSGGFPTVDFRRGECSFCRACVDVCHNGSLQYSADTAPWQLLPRISTACLARRGVVCLTCAEQCDAEAITLQHHVGQVAMPVIDASTCTGCGACVRPCPASAIHLSVSPPTGQSPTLQEVSL